MTHPLILTPGFKKRCYFHVQSNLVEYLTSSPVQCSYCNLENL